MTPEPMSEEYKKFAQGAAGMRKVTLQFMRFNPKSALSLFQEVYRYDPDPELRQLAYDVLVTQGITPTRDDDAVPRPAILAASDTPISTSGSPLSTAAPRSSSALRDAGIGSLPTSDALSRNEEKARRALAAEDSPALSSPAAPSYFDTPRPGELDGGSGRPVQRGTQLGSVFTLNKGNFNYLTGSRDTPANDLMGMIGAVIIITLMQVFFFFASRSTRSGRDDLSSISIIFIIIGLVFLGIGIRSYLSARDFHKHGVLLLGQVLSANGRWVTSGSGKNRSRKYRVTVAYRVRLPDGRVIEDNTNATRGDLSNKPLPEPGDPVAVLALPDSSKTRLL